jgi:hypothetical protein
MQTIHSKQHKELVGSVNDAPYKVIFDADGYAEVEDAIAEQLTSADYGVDLIDEDGAIIDPNAQSAPQSDDVVNNDDPDAKKEEAPKTSARASKAKAKEGDAE